MKIAVTGASGMLGTALIYKFGDQYQVYATSRSQGLIKKNVYWHCFDLTDLERLESWLLKTKPDVVIHCAAMVNVDECEIKEDLAYQLHVKTTEIIANFLNNHNGQLIYISTDSVFDGFTKKKYSEEDLTNPLNVYSKTKLLGESSVLSMKKGVVLRTNIIGWSMKDKISFAEWVLINLVKKKPIKLFNDVFISPLHVSELSEIIIQLIKRKVTGLYHVSSQDSLSKYDFGLIMAEAFECSPEYFHEISVDDLGLKAKRPKNIALSNQKITQLLGYDFSYSCEAVNIMKEEYKNGYLAQIKNREIQKNYEFWK